MESGVTSGTRIHNNQSHNLVLYQLSYSHMERDMGIEPTYSAWKADVLANVLIPHIWRPGVVSAVTIAAFYSSKRLLSSANSVPLLDYCGQGWWIWSDSNRLPRPCKGRVLPGELQTHFKRAKPPFYLRKKYLA